MPEKGPASVSRVRDRALGFVERREGVRRGGALLPLQHGLWQHPETCPPLRCGPRTPASPRVEQHPICPPCWRISRWSGDFSDTSWPLQGLLPQPQLCIRRR